MPVGATQALDFRGPQGVETPGVFSPAKAIFVTPDSVILAAPFVQLASDPLETLSVRNRRALADVFEATVTTTRLVDVIHELTTAHADMSRAVVCQPRIASRDGKIKHLLAGQVVKAVEVGIGMPEWPGVQQRHYAVYRVLRGDGTTDLHRKYLSTLATKYRLNDTQVVDEFTPPELPKEEPVRPSTTLTESFPGSSSTLGGDQTWTEIAQAWSNVSGVGSYDTDGATGSARCEGTLSTDDMRVTVTITREGGNNTSYGGCDARYAAAADTCYKDNSNRAINDYYCSRRTAGSDTDIITSELSGSITLPATDKIEVDGDQVEIFEGSNSRGSTTDTNISGNVRGGLGWFSGGVAVRFDNWQAEDLAAGNVSVTPTTAALVTATFAPTVTASDHKTVTPTTAALTTSTFAPTVTASDHKTVTPSTLALTTAAFAPTVTVGDNKTVTPGTKALVLTTFAPTVEITDHKTIIPGTGVLTITTFAPAVTSGAGIVVTPITAELLLETFAPVVTGGGGAPIVARADNNPMLVSPGKLMRRS